MNKSVKRANKLLNKLSNREFTVDDVECMEMLHSLTLILYDEFLAMQPKEADNSKWTYERFLEQAVLNTLIQAYNQVVDSSDK